MRISAPLRRSRRLISLTPLIDVVFILLLFFMLASNLAQWRAISITTAGSSDDMQATPLRIQLEADGAVRLDGLAIDLDTLLAQVSEAMLSQPGRPLIMQADSAVSLQAIITLLDSLRAAGGQQLSLQRGEDAAP